MCNTFVIVVVVPANTLPILPARGLKNASVELGDGFSIVCAVYADGSSRAMKVAVR